MADVTESSNLPNPYNSSIALGFTPPLTEMRTRNLPGVKEQPSA
jgi:hypothetical protein